MRSTKREADNNIAMVKTTQQTASLWEKYANVYVRAYQVLLPQP